jgi:hypothetical protein
MNFPSIGFFIQINQFHDELKLDYLFNSYFKLHNILFTNLYIRIYRYKLMTFGKRSNTEKQPLKYEKIDREKFAHKLNKKKRGYFKIKKSELSNYLAKKGKRYYSTTMLNSFVFDLSDEQPVRKKNYDHNRKNYDRNRKHKYNKGKKFSNNNNDHKEEKKKKKKFVFINKFKDCGNEYDFDPFFPGTTNRLNDFNFNRSKKISDRESSLVIKPLDLTKYDPRFKNVRFKYFNKYVLRLISDVYKNKKIDKNEFILVLKKNLKFFYYFLRFLKKRILLMKNRISVLRKSLRGHIYRLSLIYRFLNMDRTKLLRAFSYLKKKKYSFFKVYHKLKRSYNNIRYKFTRANKAYKFYQKHYFSLLSSFKEKYNKDIVFNKGRIRLRKHKERIKKYEKVHSFITRFRNRARFPNSYNLYRWRNQWYKRKTKPSIYITLNQYVILYRAVYQYLYLRKLAAGEAIIYIKSTITNVYLYFIYQNKILFKKSCGELPDIKKKERRFWRNVFAIIESFFPFLVQMKLKYRFGFVSLYMNGSSSLCTPLLSSIRRYNKKFRRVVYFLMNELDFFVNKTLEIKDKYKGGYRFFPMYRLKFYSILDGFNRLSKVFFFINKIKDITSWPYNGCRRRKTKRKNAR